ncbi:MAG TPA: hypothetical protein VHL80_06055 [Polyangia bacterium]|nr:hypothetical protein [Polyangia bacterium]
MGVGGAASTGIGGSGGVSSTGVGGAVGSGTGGVTSTGRGGSGGAGGGGVPGPKKIGESCVERIDCASTFCENGVCCGSSCEGNCQSCALPGSTGACKPLPAGTVCVPAQCNGNMASGGFTCDGKGGCPVIPQPARICAPYACNPATATCNTTCASDADCFNSKCVNGACGLTPIGAKCANGSECATGFCADGQCCNVACQGPCVSCVLAGREGTCWPIDAGGLDPHGRCIDQGAASCGTNGRCDGLGACASYPPGTSCSPASCTGSTLTMAGQCNSLQQCVAGAASCAPYACRADAPLCRIDCPGGDANCAAGFYCGDDALLCHPKKAPGNSCLSGHECASNDCGPSFPGSTVVCQPL